MPPRAFNFAFEPLGEAILPSIREWDLYQRVITFTFYHHKGDGGRPPGIYANGDEMEDTRKVIASFRKRVEGNYARTRMKLLMDYFTNMMNSGSGSLSMARYFGLDGVVVLKGFTRKQVDFNGCLVSCWRRYIAALRSEDVKLMVMFSKRIIMPQVDMVFYNLGILNKHQPVVYRIAEDSESLEVNHGDAWEDFEDPEAEEQRNAEVGEARKFVVNKGKGKKVTFDLKNVQASPENRSGGTGSTKAVKKRSPRRTHESSNRRSGIKNDNGEENIENILVNRKNDDKDSPRKTSPLTKPQSPKVIKTQRKSRYLLRSTVQGCKKQVAEIKKKIVRVTSRNLRSTASEEITEAPGK